MNYHLLMEDTIKNLQKDKPRLILHSCCAPCSTHVLSELTRYFSVTLYYYNPNIYPQEEYLKRKAEQLSFAALVYGNAVAVMDDDYLHDDFLKVISGLGEEKEGGERCKKCIDMRIKNTAEKAKAHGFDFFTTTLTVSPHKNADFINTAGFSAEKDIASGITKYLPADFKKRGGYLNSTNLSKKYGLYRQNYCGCEYSIW